MDLDQAVTKHAEWKMKFRAAITKQETMDVATISKDNCCELGKWLHGEAKAKYGKLGSHSECVGKHATFHVEAGKVAIAINLKKYKEASAMLDVGTPYAAASSAVAVAIMHLKKKQPCKGASIRDRTIA
ncbi:Chemotaxis protein [Georgfuchsia toluolica]|uniref:Chemotaxis protein n=2 Tax=Georgfuchsia toluolica TaxID=424218 RepID=A0A916J2D3_9PROT|nr:Chemotaxis protein [Georgfuchsia toluolica]